MSTNAMGGDPLTQIQGTTKTIAQALGVLYKQVVPVDPSGGQISKMVTQMIEGIAAIEEAIQQPPAPQPMMDPRAVQGPIDQAGADAMAMMAAQGGVPEQGGF